MNSSESPKSRKNDNESSLDEQLDWYVPEKSKTPRQLSDLANTAQKSSRFHSMIQKLHIGTTLAALVLFFLPWIDIQCSQNSFATQTGIQTIYGGGSPSKEIKSFIDEDRQMKSGDEKKGDESAGYSPLVALALLAVICAVFVSFKALRSNDESQNRLVGIFCATALILISAQMMMGFPVKESLGKSMAEASKANASDASMKEFSSGMAVAMMMNIQVRHLPALYIELIMLGLPTLVLANGLIDKMKKS